jgi:hypothetical protein
MLRLSTPWRWFVAIEMFALIAGWTSGVFMSELGPALWEVSFMLLLPGLLLVGAPVEHALWNTGLSLTAIDLTESLASIVANALLFAAVLWAIRSIRGRRAI